MKTVRDVAALIGTSTAYQAVIRAIGWGDVPCKDVIIRLQDAVQAIGQPALNAASDDLLDFPVYGGVPHARIKPSLEVHCRMLLGPMPSEWATWWQNPDGTDRAGKPKDWPPVLPGPPIQPPVTNSKQRRSRPRSGPLANAPPKTLKAVSEPTSDAPAENVELHALSLPALAERLHAARARWHAAKPSSRIVPKIHAEILRIEAEYRRRGLVIPESSRPKVARSKNGAA